MKVTIKGQVTIPKDVREKLDIQPLSEVEFVEERGRVFLVKKEPENRNKKRFARLRGSASERMYSETV